MIQLPGSSVLPKAAKSLHKTRMIQSKKDRNSSHLHDKTSMTEDEHLRLKVASKHLLNPTIAVSGNKKLSPYYVANTKLKKIRQGKKFNPDNVEVRSRLLEHYFIINRNELEVSEF